MFYVYEYRNPISKEPFYVGKGNGPRKYVHLIVAQSPVMLDKNRHRTNTIKKMLREGITPEIIVVFNTDNEDEAYAEEIRLIKLYGRRDLGTGPLTNLSAGGEGNYLPGDKNPMFGRHHTKESKEQLSKTRKDRIKKGIIKPTRHSKEWREELRRNNAGGKATSKSVSQFDLDGNFIKEWPSALLANKTLGINRNSISNAMKEKWKTPGGFYWRKCKYEIIDLDLCEKQREKHSSPIRNFRTIDQYSLNGEFIKTWPTISSAARKLGLSIDLLARIRKGNRKPELGGFIWKNNYFGDDNG